jgi:hypothetical protein
VQETPESSFGMFHFSTWNLRKKIKVYKAKLEETRNHNQKHVDLPRKGSYSSIEEGCLFV